MIDPAVKVRHCKLVKQTQHQQQLNSVDMFESASLLTHHICRQFPSTEISSIASHSVTHLKRMWERKAANLEVKLRLLRVVVRGWLQQRFCAGRIVRI